MEFGLKRVRKASDLTYTYINNMHHYMILKMNLGQHREAEELGQRILQLSAAMGHSTGAGLTLFNLGRNSYFEGDYAKAKEYLQQSREILSSEEAFSP